MPDVNQGLSTSEELDVNTDAGFTARLAAKVGADLSPEQLESLQGSDRSVASGLETEEESARRDDRGRVAPEAPASEEEQVAPEEGSEEVEENPDPALVAFIDKHGGDRDAALIAALREAQEAQSLIGRQSQEVGQVREEIARLRGMVEARGEPEKAPAALPYVDSETVESIENMIAQEGPHATIGWLNENRPELVDVALEVWGADNPVAASRFAARLETLTAQQEAQLRAQPQQEVDPYLDQLRSDAMMRETATALSRELGAEQWEQIKSHIPAVLDDENTPTLVRAAFVHPDPRVRMDAARALVPYARLRANEAASQEAAAQRSSQLVEQKKVASLGNNGSLRPVEQERQPATGSVEDMSSEDRIAVFKKLFREQDTNSVQSGLTYD